MYKAVYKIVLRLLDWCYYLLQLFPLLHRWGATGLLVEYEDMFPYWGELTDIAAPNAYTYVE